MPKTASACLLALSSCQMQYIDMCVCSQNVALTQQISTTVRSSGWVKRGLGLLMFPKVQATATR